MLIAMVLVAAAILTVGTWAASSWMKPTGASSTVDKYAVSAQTFKVALKEKGELKAAKSTDIKCEVEGRSTIISLIPEGAAVKEGDLLVELASDEIENKIRTEELKETNAITTFEAAKTELDIQKDRNESDIRKAELQIELKQLALERYEKGDWEQQLKDAQIAIDQAKILLERRTQDWQASQELYSRKFITQTEHDEDRFNYQKAMWDLEKAEKAKEVLETYTDRAERRQKQSDLEEAKKECDRVRKNAKAEETKKLRALEGAEKELSIIRDQLAKYRGQKEKCRIQAPTPGFVVYYSESSRWGGNEDQIKEGAQVFERQTLMQLPDTSQMMVVVRVHEAKTERLQLGQPVVVQVEGLAGRQFAGKVTKIAVLADSSNRWLNPDLKEYETQITLDETDPALKPGATAQAEILVETAENRMAVPIQTIFSKAGRRYVFRDRGAGTVEPVEIKLGAVGTEWAEILEGVKEKDNILLAFSDSHRRLVPDLPPAMGPRMGPGGPRPMENKAEGTATQTSGEASGGSRPAGGGRGTGGGGAPRGTGGGGSRPARQGRS